MNELFSTVMSFMLVIVMAFSSLGGMTADMEETMSFEVKASMDGEALNQLIAEQEAAREAARKEWLESMGLTAEDVATEAPAEPAEDAEEEPDTGTIVSDLLGAFSIRGVADRETIEAGLFSNGSKILTFGVKNTEEGSILATSLLSKYVITFSREILDQLQQQMTESMTQSATGYIPEAAAEAAGASTAGAYSQMDIQALTEKLQSLDMEQIAKDYQEVMEAIGKAIGEKAGETENGEFAVDGFTFTAKTPVNISYDEMMELLLNGSKDLLNRESLKPVVEALSSSSSDPVASIDEALENLKTTPEDEKYDLSVVSYAMDDGVTAYYIVDLSRKASEDGTREAEQIHAGIGTVDGQTRMIVNAADGSVFELMISGAENGPSRIQASIVSKDTTMALDMTSEEGTTDVTIDILTGNMPVKVHIVTAEKDGNTDILAEVFLKGAETPLGTLTVTVSKGGEHLCVYEGEEIQQVPIETLMNPDDTTAVEKLGTAMGVGILTAAGMLKMSLPKDTGNWIFQQLMKMVKTDTTTQTAPDTGE